MVRLASVDEEPLVIRGIPEAKIRMIVEGVAPKLDVFVNGSTDVNLGRAQQCASVARPEASDAPSEVRLLSVEEVLALKGQLPKDVEAPDVVFSLFVQLEQDLDPEVRTQALETIESLARRARWKMDAASVEVPGDKIRDLHATPGVSYVEPGQTLRAPEPIVADATTPPHSDLRRVATHARRHRYGQDVLVGIIDVGGFDFAHEDFLEPGGGGTRWVAIWDQGGTVRPAPCDRRPGDRFKALGYGSEILKKNMDAAIAGAAARRMAATRLEPQSVMSVGSHGTHVASIAAGRRGVARRAHLAGVLIALQPEDTSAERSFYDSTRIADAVDYLLALAAELGGTDGPLPVSINISLGTNGHAHDTSSAMARWIDSALTSPGRCVSVAAGNAGQVEPRSPTDMGFLAGRIHAGGTFAATNLRHELGWIVAGGEIADISENEMEIWYSPSDRIDVEIRPPGGQWIGPISPGLKARSAVLDNGTVLSVHSETYHPANGANRISILLSPFFAPQTDGVRSIGPIAPGEWRVRLTGRVVRDGRYDAWIERDDPRAVAGPRGRLWHYPSYFAPGSYTTDRMINSLACAERLLSVANVDVARNAPHVTSSRGPTRDGRFKPDIGADGTDIVAARGFDRTRPWISMTGTSMASPYISGVAALMLAIAPRLTSAQILGIIRMTSSPLAGHDFAWRNDLGFGLIDAAACVEQAAEYEAARKTSHL
jgi:subtilisin family serine protease